MSGDKEDISARVSLEFLRTHSLFGGLEERELKKIRALLEIRSFASGEEIIRESEPGGTIYLIHRGSVEVIKSDPNKPGRPPVRLAVLSTGDSFGEMEMIDCLPSVATVRTLEETDVLILTQEKLYRIEEEDPTTFTMIIMNLARDISRRLRVMDLRAARAAFGKSDRTRKKSPTR